MQPGSTNTIVDIEGLLVGHAQDEGLKSGVTVLTGHKPFAASCHVMGGAPGTRETDLLAPDKTVPAVDAICLSGGSAFGLAACDGVAAGLRAAGRGFAVGPVLVPLVPGAIIFDLINGGQKDWQRNPYSALGEAAFAARAPECAIGSVGAGTGALTGHNKGGIGSASLLLPGGALVAALVVTNPLGRVTVPGGSHFWAAPFELGDEFGGLGADQASGQGALEPSRRMQAMGMGPAEQGNTTIGIVATNAALNKAQCQRVAIAAHDGIARAIVPSHSPYDGDMLFSVATGQGAGAGDEEVMAIGHGAALCVARAIARSVFAARPAPGDLLPCWPD